MKQLFLVAAAVLGLAATAAPASANLQYTLNCSANPCSTSGNYGTVTLHQVGTGASAYVTVAVKLAPNEVFASTGAGYPIAWNIAGNPTLSSITVTSANASFFTPQFADPTDTTNPAPVYSRYKASPFTGGSCGPTTASCFDYAIAGNWSGTNHFETGLIFDVKKSGGLLLSDFAATSNGYYFSADIGTCTTSGGQTRCSNTFTVASNTHPVPVPEPLTLSLFGLGFAGTVALRRRKKIG